MDTCETCGATFQPGYCCHTARACIDRLLVRAQAAEHELRRSLEISLAPDVVERMATMSQDRCYYCDGQEGGHKIIKHADGRLTVCSGGDVLVLARALRASQIEGDQQRSALTQAAAHNQTMAYHLSTAGLARYAEPPTWELPRGPVRAAVDAIKRERGRLSQVATAALQDLIDALWMY